MSFQFFFLDSSFVLFFSFFLSIISFVFLVRSCSSEAAAAHSQGNYVASFLHYFRTEFQIKLEA